MTYFLTKSDQKGLFLEFKTAYILVEIEVVVLIEKDTDSVFHV